MRVLRPLKAGETASESTQPDGAPQHGGVGRSQEDEVVLYECESTERLERALQAVCALRGETDHQKVFQDLFNEQLNRGLMAIAGVEPGPRLVVDNTKPKGRKG